MHIREGLRYRGQKLSVYFEQ
ncbi:MAG: hypothetical protein RIR99_880, partial [Actinomycetota bacterium]